MLFPMINVLYFYISTLQSMYAVPNMAVYCSSLMLWFPGMLFRYFLNNLEMVLIAPSITVITFDLFWLSLVLQVSLLFWHYIRHVSIVSVLYFKIFAVSFLITLLSPENAMSINRQFRFHHFLLILILLRVFTIFIITQCSRIHSERLLALQLVEAFSTLHTTWRFIAMLTISHHFSLFWAIFISIA
jgi:hypothetical protein